MRRLVALLTMIVSILGLGMAVADPSMAALVVASVLLSWPAFLIVRAGLRIALPLLRRAMGKAVFLVASGGLLVAALVITSLVLSLGYKVGVTSGGLDPLPVSEYTVRIECGARVSDSCSVRPELSIDGRTLHLQGGEVKPQQKGLLLYEVAVAPTLEIAVAQLPASVVQTHIKLPGSEAENRAVLDGRIEILPGKYCARVVDLARDSFLEARLARDLSRLPYLGTEAIEWCTTWPEMATFSFVRPPFQSLRPLVAAFSGAASVPAWLLAMGGGVVGLIFGAVVKPLAFRALDDSLERLRGRYSKPAPKSLIILTDDPGPRPPGH